nr:DrmE family protein [Halobacterium salinarum]
MSSLTLTFIVTPNTSVRDRYEQLRNGMQYSTERWPLATVKANKELSYRTEHVHSSDAPPGVIFTRFSTRLPNDEISSEIRTVLYDDAVKFEEERWEQFQSWQDRNDIPSVVYLIRDPLGPVYQRVKDDLDVVWAWTPTGIQSTLGDQQSSVDDDVPSVLETTNRERQFLKQKASGQTHRIHACTEGDVVEAFADLWSAFEELEDAADDIDEHDLYVAVGVAKRAINGFTRLLSSLEYSDNYRSKHGKATTLSGRVSQLEHIMDGLSGDAAAGRTPVEHVHHALSELRDTLTDTESQKWKRGAVLTAIQKVTDENEDLIIVLPDEPARQALQADLRIKLTDFYSEARSHVHLHTPQSLPNADPADYLLLYGPPKYDHRWLLRAPHAPDIGVLAYDHELGLLHSQVRDLNREMEHSTPDMSEAGLQTQILNTISAPAPLPENQENTASTTSSPTDPGQYDGVSIDIPDPDTEDNTQATPFDDYELVEGGSSESVDDLIEDHVPDFTGDATYTPDTTRSSTTNSREPTNDSRQVEGCIGIRVQDGKAIALPPTASLEVVNTDAGTIVEKPVSSIQSGDRVVVVEDRDRVRDEVEELLLDSGHIDLIGYARLWKNQLHTEIERRDDSLEDFIQRLEEQGLDKTRSTYRSWYYGDLHLPRAKDSLYALAQAYEIDEVLEEFENVWTANHKIRKIKRGFLDRLKHQSQEALAADEEGDPVIDEELDIRLSDLNPTDEAGTPFVQVYFVTEVADVGTFSRSQVGQWRDIG